MRKSNFFFVCLTLGIALVLQFLPWTASSLLWRPHIAFVALVYWLMRAPNLCNIGTSWLVGLLIDIFTGGLLGQYALVYTICAYFILTYQRRLVLFNPIQIWAYAFIALLSQHLLLYLVKSYSNQSQQLVFSVWPIITSILLWLALVFLLGLPTKPKT